MLGYLIVGGILTFVVVPSVFRAIAKTNRGKHRQTSGTIGEARVDRCLRKFKGREFARAKDVMLSSHGKTSQIDNILVSRYGIFVIEMKNFAGTVKGKEHEPKWMHISPGRNKTPREFYNPIWQNEGHITALRKLLEKSLPNIPFHNIVVFSDECRSPKIPGVVTLSELRDALQERMNGRPVLSQTDVAAIKDIIDSNNIKNKRKRSQHITYAQGVADNAKQREVDKARRMTAEANKDMALKVQREYSGGLVSLEQTIVSAESKVVEPENKSLAEHNEISR